MHGTVFGAVVVGGGASGRMLEATGGGGVKDVTPPGAPLLQGVAITSSGRGYASGAMGAIYERATGGVWRAVDTKLSLPPIESLHAVWIDPSGGVWAVGGNVVCEQSEWDALELARPGYHTLLHSGIETEQEAEKLARGTAGDTFGRGSGRKAAKPLTAPLLPPAT